MASGIKISGAWRNIGVPFIKVAGAWRSGQLYIKRDGVWRLFAGELKAAVSPSSASAFVNTQGGGNHTGYTNDVTVSVSGGIAPYSYLWQLVAGNMIATNNPTSARTGWNALGSGNAVRHATFRCEVKDAQGTIVYTPNVNVTIEFSNGL